VDQTNPWNDTAPTSTEFTVGTDSYLNANGDSYVAYLFAHNDGDGDFGPDGDADIIKCGSYTGNGSTTGPEIDLGFEPQWLLVKNANDSSGRWLLLDNMRGWGMGDADLFLNAHLSAAELGSQNWFDITPTGFKVTNSNGNVNGNGNTHIYIAIRRGPMAVPESATDVFAIDTLDSTGPGFDSNFVVDMAFERNVSSASDTRIASRLTGATALRTNTTEAESTQSSNVFDFMDGWFYDGTSNSSKYSWMWKRAPNYFDVVAYSGASGTQTIKHNLGVKPEAILIKQRSGATGWIWWYDAFGDNQTFIRGDLSNATFTNTTYFNNTAPTDTEISLGFHSNVSGTTSTDYIAYLFASLDGVSKVGSYTGNGTSTGDAQNIDCGFSSGARFVLIKASSVAYSWMLFDTERGITSGNDSLLILNSTSAETTAFDSVDPYSSGFTAVQGPYNVNQNGVEYIFYAIA
jgi:hypothetical protein